MFKGRPLASWPRPSSGLSFSAEMEWVYTAKFHEIPTMEFLKLPVEDKVFLIAAFRVDAEAQAVMAQHRKDYPDEYK